MEGSPQGLTSCDAMRKHRGAADKKGGKNMMGPRELLRCAAENRRNQPPRPPREELLPVRPAAVQSHHATYTALMHSHDRMRTRHLPGQGGEKRA